MLRRMLHRVPILIVVEILIIILLVSLPPQEWMNLLVALFMAILVYLLQIWMHRVVLAGFDRRRAFLGQRVEKKLLVGALLGVGSMLLIVALIWSAGGFSPGQGYLEYAKGNPELIAQSSRPGASSQYMRHIGSALLVYASSALGEELAFRMIGMGMIMMLFSWLSARRRRRAGLAPPEEGVRWRAWVLCGAVVNLVISVVFALIHSGSPGWTLLSLANIALSSATYGLLFVLQGNLLGAWAMHWLWNVTQAAMGLPVSGKLAAAGPLIGFGFAGARDGALSGGQYGPEGSALAVVVQAAVLSALVVVSWRSLKSLSPR